MGNWASLTMAQTALAGCFVTEVGTWVPGSESLSRGWGGGRGSQEGGGRSKQSAGSVARIALVQTNMGSSGGLRASFNLLAIRTEVQTQVKEQPGKPAAAAWSALAFTVHWSCRVSKSSVSPKWQIPSHFQHFGHAIDGNFNAQKLLLPEPWFCY